MSSSLLDDWVEVAESKRVKEVNDRWQTILTNAGKEFDSQLEDITNEYEEKIRALELRLTIPLAPGNNLDTAKLNEANCAATELKIKCKELEDYILANHEMEAEMRALERKRKDQIKSLEREIFSLKVKLESSVVDFIEEKKKTANLINSPSVEEEKVIHLETELMLLNYEKESLLLKLVTEKEKVTRLETELMMLNYEKEKISFKLIAEEKVKQQIITEEKVKQLIITEEKAKQLIITQEKEKENASLKMLAEEAENARLQLAAETAKEKENDRLQVLAEEAEKIRLRQVAEEAEKVRLKIATEEEEKEKVRLKLAAEEKARLRQVAEEKEKARLKLVAEEAEKARLQLVYDEKEKNWHRQIAEKKEEGRLRLIAQESEKARLKLAAEQKYKIELQIMENERVAREKANKEGSIRNAAIYKAQEEKNIRRRKAYEDERNADIERAKAVERAKLAYLNSDSGRREVESLKNEMQRLMKAQEILLAPYKTTGGFSLPPNCPQQAQSDQICTAIEAAKNRIYALGSTPPW